MTQEEFEKRYKEPVDLDKVHEALGRFINGKGVLRVPATPKDDDMLISRALNELKNMRARCAIMESFLDDIDCHIRSTEDSLPYIVNTMKEYFEYCTEGSND